MTLSPCFNVASIQPYLITVRARHSSVRPCRLATPLCANHHIPTIFSLPYCDTVALFHCLLLNHYTSHLVILPLWWYHPAVITLELPPPFTVLWYSRRAYPEKWQASYDVKACEICSSGKMACNAWCKCLWNWIGTILWIGQKLLSNCHVKLLVYDHVSYTATQSPC